MTNIDYEEQMTQIEEEKQNRLTETGETYNQRVEQSQQKFDDLIDASKAWVDKQSALQQEQSDFAIKKIEQEKEQTKKDYTKEQSGAYADWQKESNRYGAGAEELAAAGLSNSGYSESSQVQMYNTYQNRVAVARESYNLAILNYNNAIKEAQLQNSSALAEIAYTGLQQQLQLALQSVQYENQLLSEMESQKAKIEDTYHNRYQDVLNQMNTDRAFEESVRQYNEEMERLRAQDEAEKRRFEESVRQYNQNYEEGVRQFEIEMERLIELDKRDYELALKELEEKKRQNDLAYGNNGAGGIIKKPTVNAEDVGAGVAKKAIVDQVTSGYYPGKTMNNNEITDYIKSVLANKATSNSFSSARTNTQKLTTQEKRMQAEQQKADIAYEVSTPYYRGVLSNDALEFGTRANGYQPKGISGHGYLSKTDETITFDTVVNYGTQKGKMVEVEQNIWKAEDGTRWVWSGNTNKYVPYEE